VADTELARSPHRATAVEVIDCTLRDGEQTPGVWFTVEEKVRLARLLAEAGIGLLDAGFPGASGADLDAMQEMRHCGVAARLGATARPLRQDIAAAAKAQADEVFLFMPTSDLRLRETLGITRDQAAQLLRSGVAEVLGENMGLNVVFEDATRADPELLIRLVNDVCQPGTVSRLVLADSVGCAHPAGMRTLVRTLARRVDPAIAICTHAHNDYGLATANTLAAVDAGARAITCTVNGIGERAGNADLAECVAALTHLYGVRHSVRAELLPELASFVERASGIHMSATKPVTGYNVYRHESGVHVDSMLKDTRSYEMLPPGWTGRERDYVLGKHSGASLIRHILNQANPPRAVDEDITRRLVDLVKRAVESKDKAQHEQAYAAKEAFTASALAGISPDVVISEYDRLCVDGSA
jgi:isopropylmalate/homocitrate/citramalate synthase